MIFMTAMAIGVAAGLMRSAFSVALIAALIGLSYAGAWLVSPGPVPVMSLLEAVAGYNGGLISLVAGYLVVSRLTDRQSVSRS